MSKSETAPFFELHPSLNLFQSVKECPNFLIVIFNVPQSLTVKCGKRLSIYLTQLVNEVIRFSHYLEFKDFKQYILFNISDLFLEFDLNFLRINC
jgi:hypothetical protein